MSDTNKSGRPHIEYRVELEKRIQINKSFSERRNQAVAMRILSYGLFGQKRYQNLYLTCSLNCFHLALKIANQIHQRVAGLAMIIRFQTVQILEYFSEAVNGKYFEERKYSKINIKLTRNPTDEDKKQPGYNPGLSADDVQEPLTEVLIRKKRNNWNRQTRGKTEYQPKGQQRKDNKYREKDNRDNKNNERKKKYRETNDERVEIKGKYMNKNDHPNYKEQKEYQEKGRDKETRNYYDNKKKQQTKYQEKSKYMSKRNERNDPDANRTRKAKRNRYEGED